MRQVVRNALAAIAGPVSALIIGAALHYFALTLARRIRSGGIAV